jgi:hypothetical protein
MIAELDEEQYRAAALVITGLLEGTVYAEDLERLCGLKGRGRIPEAFDRRRLRLVDNPDD